MNFRGRFDYNPLMKKLSIVLPILLILLACSPAKTPSTLSNLTSFQGKIITTKQYIVRQQLSLVNEGDGKPEKQNLWVALIRDVPPYQKVLSKKISPDSYTLVTDEYGNQYAEFDFSDHPAGTTITVDIDYKVAVNELAYDLSPCEGDLPDEFTQPELHIESANPQIQSLSKELSRGKKTACDQVRAFYDYAGDNLIYTYNQNDWGAQATLGPMGADCTEYADLTIALSRAAGIPARYYEGLLYLDAQTNHLAKTEHAWLDAYLPGSGWVAVDPTLGRALVNRDTFFAHYTPNHIIVTTGRNPSTLRGASYWTHLYWPGNSTIIRVQDAGWTITPSS
jgi:transglutaminase-like putative cysteine protease